MRAHFASTLILTLASPLLVTSSLAQAPTAASQEVTVTGCIERADQVATRGNTADVDSLDFVLMKVEAANSSDSPTGTSGRDTVPGKPDPAGVGALYRLRGQTDQINPHVGHQVEIAGVVAPATAEDGGQARAAAIQPAPPVPASSARPAPLLNVTRLRLISENCPQSAR